MVETIVIAHAKLTTGTINCVTRTETLAVNGVWILIMLKKNHVCLDGQSK